MVTMSRNEQLRRNLGHDVYEPSLEGRLTIFTEPGVEDLPLPIRKAMAVKLMLETVPVHIYSGELIVGIGFLEHPLEGDKPRSIIPEYTTLIIPLINISKPAVCNLCGFIPPSLRSGIENLT